MQPDYIHLAEALFAAMTALGAWIWRVSSKLQSYEEQLQTLKASVADVQNKRSVLEELKITQAVQGAKIDNIEKTCLATNQAILEILADRMPGGNRKGDPPGRTP